MSPAQPPKKIDYDERVYRKGHPPHRIRNALILIGLILVGTYFAITKSIPFKPEYELHAVFENAANIRKDSPVRIAGVNVGEVTAVRRRGTGDGYLLDTTGGTVESRNVVVATGGFPNPKVPSMADRLPRRVSQLHSSEYRNPGELPAGAVLVDPGAADS